MQNSIIKQQLRNSIKEASLNENADYKVKVTTSEYAAPKSGQHLRRHTTFVNKNVAEMPTKFDFYTNALKDMKQVLNNIVVILAQKGEEFEDMKDTLNIFKDNFNKLEIEQEKLDSQQRVQMEMIENNYFDFNEHKKVINELVQENNELVNNVEEFKKDIHLIKKIELPIIKQQLVQKSTITINPLRSSTNMAPNLKLSNLHPPPHISKKEQSLYSAEFNYNDNQSDEESNNGIIYNRDSETHDLDHLENAESSEDTQSEGLNNTFDRDQHPEPAISSFGKHI